MNHQTVVLKYFETGYFYMASIIFTLKTYLCPKYSHYILHITVNMSMISKHWVSSFLFCFLPSRILFYPKYIKSEPLTMAVCLFVFLIWLKYPSTSHRGLSLFGFCCVLVSWLLICSNIFFFSPVLALWLRTYLPREIPPAPPWRNSLLWTPIDQKQQIHFVTTMIAMISYCKLQNQIRTPIRYAAKEKEAVVTQNTTTTTLAIFEVWLLLILIQLNTNVKLCGRMWRNLSCSMRFGFMDFQSWKMCRGKRMSSLSCVINWEMW